MTATTNILQTTSPLFSEVFEYRQKGCDSSDIFIHPAECTAATQDVNYKRASLTYQVTQLQAIRSHQILPWLQRVYQVFLQRAMWVSSWEPPEEKRCWPAACNQYISFCISLFIWFAGDDLHETWSCAYPMHQSPFIYVENWPSNTSINNLVLSHSAT